MPENEKVEAPETTSEADDDSRRRFLAKAAAGMVAAAGALAVGLAAEAEGAETEATRGTKVRINRLPNRVEIVIESEELSRILVEEGLRPEILRDRPCGIAVGILD